jgi:hypothetical protein
LRRARPFLHQKLLSAPGVVEALTELESDRPDYRVGVHIRLGDFSADSPGRGQFNRSLPIEWYREAMAACREALGGATSFLVCSDARDADLEPLVEGDVRVFRGSGQGAAVQELIALAEADLMICSVSSFSMLAVFLSQKPYLWYEPQLVAEGNRYSIWDVGASPTTAAAAPPFRGLPFGDAAQNLPGWFVDTVADRRLILRSDSDLVLGGVIARSPSGVPPIDERVE